MPLLFKYIDRINENFFVINKVSGPKQPHSALPPFRQLTRHDRGLTKFPLSISLPFPSLKLLSNSDSLNKS